MCGEEAIINRSNWYKGGCAGKGALEGEKGRGEWKTQMIDEEEEWMLRIG